MLVDDRHLVRNHLWREAFEGILRAPPGFGGFLAGSSIAVAQLGFVKRLGFCIVATSHLGDSGNTMTQALLHCDGRLSFSNQAPIAEQLFQL